MKDTERKKIESIHEERRNEVISLRQKLNDVQKELDSVVKKISRAGIKGGEVFSEYASYRKKLDREISSVAKKLADATEEFKKADERLRQVRNET